MPYTRRKSCLNSTADAQRLFSVAAAAKFIGERGEEKKCRVRFASVKRQRQLNLEEKGDFRKVNARCFEINLKFKRIRGMNKELHSNLASD